MLSSLCQELKNWFDRDQPKIHGAFEISGGKIIDEDFTDVIQDNQYFRIIGSVFNDGVHKYTDDLQLTDELFVGHIWLMAIPKDFLALAEEIKTWQDVNGKPDSSAMSPFYSESFGGYSYTKSAGSVHNQGASTTWQSTYASRLNMYRKIRES